MLISNNTYKNKEKYNITESTYVLHCTHSVLRKIEKPFHLHLLHAFIHCFPEIKLCLRKLFHIFTLVILYRFLCEKDSKRQALTGVRRKEWEWCRKGVECVNTLIFITPAPLAHIHRLISSISEFSIRHDA